MIKIMRNNRCLQLATVVKLLKSHALITPAYYYSLRPLNMHYAVRYLCVESNFWVK